jgi:hypothetical protein
MIRWKRFPVKSSTLIKDLITLSQGQESISLPDEGMVQSVVKTPDGIYQIDLLGIWCGLAVAAKLQFTFETVHNQNAVLNEYTKAMVAMLAAAHQNITFTTGMLAQPLEEPNAEEEGPSGIHIARN